ARFGSWFPKPTLHHPQENRRPQTVPQSETPQPVCQPGVVQDGDSEDSMFHAPKEGLSDVCGLEGRILARVDRPCSTQVPSVCMAGQDVSFQDISIRTLPVTTCIHHDPPPSTEVGEKARDSAFRISGRSLDHGEFEREVSAGHSFGVGQIAVAGLPGQHEKSRVGAVTDTGPPGLHLQHEGHDFGGPQVETAGHSSRGDKDLEQGMDLDQELVIVRGQGCGDNSSSISSSPDDSQALSSEERSAAPTFSFVERHCAVGQRSDREPG
ncbi:hypothetical protein BGZ70_005700, partial [Mortierella alpina]